MKECSILYIFFAKNCTCSQNLIEIKDDIDILIYKTPYYITETQKIDFPKELIGVELDVEMKDEIAKKKNKYIRFKRST